MKLLLDTNVLVAALVARGTCHELLEHCVREHRRHLVSSPARRAGRCPRAKVPTARRRCAGRASAVRGDVHPCRARRPQSSDLPRPRRRCGPGDRTGRSVRRDRHRRSGPVGPGSVSSDTCDIAIGFLAVGIRARRGMSARPGQAKSAALAVLILSAPGWGVLVVLAAETVAPELLRSLGVGRWPFVCALFSPPATLMAAAAWFRSRHEMSTIQEIVASLALAAGVCGGLLAWSRLGLFTPSW